MECKSRQENVPAFKKKRRPFFFFLLSRHRQAESFTVFCLSAIIPQSYKFAKQSINKCCGSRQKRTEEVFFFQAKCLQVGAVKIGALAVLYTAINNNTLLGGGEGKKREREGPSELKSFPVRQGMWSQVCTSRS